MSLLGQRLNFLGDVFPDGGREVFAAGATGMMIGGYLTVRGRSVEKDLAMVKELGLEVS